MNRADALHHSLLRIISGLRDDTLDDGMLKELANTLQVEIVGQVYRFQWRKGNEILTREYPKDDLVFFKRGDQPEKGQQASADVEETNREIMAKIVRDMLDSPNLQIPALLPLPTRTDRPRNTIGIWPWLLLSICAIYWNQPHALLLLGILLVLVLLERLSYPWLFLGYFAMGILPWQGLAFSMLGGFVGISAIAILSPRNEGRLWQFTGAAMIMLSFGLYLAFGKSIMAAPLDWTNILAAVVCSVAILAGWSKGTNVYLVPLILPFFGLGAIWDGYGFLSMILSGLVIGRVISLEFFPRIRRSLLP